MKGTLIAIAWLGLAACGGQVSKLPSDDIVYDFDAALITTPTDPTVGAHVSLNLDLTSKSNRDVNADIILRVVGMDGRVMYQQVWSGVEVKQGEEWNLTNGFYPDSDAGRQGWKVELLVRDSAKGVTLFDEDVAQLTFNKS